MRIKTNVLSVQNTVKNLKGGFKVVKTNRPFVLLDCNGVAIGNYVNEASAARAVRRLQGSTVESASRRHSLPAYCRPCLKVFLI